jgi:hypothetical protein
MWTTVSRKSWGKKDSEKDTNGLRVIGAGLPRTGTTSLKVALEILGFGPCHHMNKIVRTPHRILEFIRAYDGEEIDFHKLMEGYGSTLDIPTSDFYKEIHQAYPQAKIILTVRDTSEKWFESFQNTVGILITSRFHYFCTYLLRFLHSLQIMLGKIYKRWNKEFGPITPSFHDQYNRRVMNENKEGEILVYNVKEGWPPLCKFLEVDIPQNIPFPNVNDTKEFTRKIKFAQIIGLFFWSVVAALFVLFIYIVMRIT